METARRSSRGGRRRRSGAPFLGQLLTVAVESAADEVAIRYNRTADPADQRETTYRELDEASSQLARVLIERGIGPGDVVAIAIARSPESVRAVWAVAKTGAAFVPIDPDCPAERIRWMAGESRVALGLTTARHRAALGSSIYWFEMDDPVQASRVAGKPRWPISYTDRLRTPGEYCPAYIVFDSDRGVVVPHGGLAQMVAAVQEIYGVTSDARVLHLGPSSGDLAIMEVLITFVAGATLVIAPTDLPGPSELAGLLSREHVSHLITTASEWESMASPGIAELSLVAVVGDRFGPGTSEFPAGGRSVVRSYGSAEVGIAAGSAPLDPGADPVRMPAPPSGVFVLDTGLRPVPDGAVGELYLTGPVLADGYLNRPAHTSAQFVAAPIVAGTGHPGGRMYRTGEPVRWRRGAYGAELEFVGRAGRPRSDARAAGGVREVSAASGGSGEGPELAAVEAPAPGAAAPDPDEAVPVPRAGPDSLPDRAVAAGPVADDPVEKPEPSLPGVGHEEWEAWRAQYPGLVEVLPVPPPGVGLYFHTLLTAGQPDDYVALYALELGRGVDLDRWHTAVRALQTRHPTLRSAFATAADGYPVQLVTETAEVPWQVVDDVGDYEMADLLAAERRTGFEIGTAPLLRVTVYRTVSGRTHSVFTAHQLLFDSRSVAILLTDLLTLYARPGGSAALPDPPPLHDYPGRLDRQGTASARARWSEVLRDAPPTELAKVLTAPEEPGTGSGEWDLVLSETETAALTRYADSAGVGVDTVLQALWALLLASLTGRDDVVFGSTVSGRPPELSRADERVGRFAGMVPVRVRFDSGRPLRELLTRLRSEQGSQYFPAPTGVPGAAALFDTLLTYEPHPVDPAVLRGAGRPAGVEVVNLVAQTGTHYPVNLVVESANRLLLRVGYRRDTVATASARALSGLLHALVGQVLAVPAPPSVTAGGWWCPPGDLVRRGDLPADRPRPDNPSTASGQLVRTVRDDLYDALNRVADRCDTDTLTVVQAALAVLLARLSGNRDAAVGAVHRGSGLSILHTEVVPAQRFDTLVACAAGDAAGRGAERLISLIDTVRTAAGRPPFRILLATDRAPIELPDQLDLRVGLADTDTGMALTFTYSRDLFDAPTIGDHADRLLRILAAVAANPGVTVGDIDLLAPGERDLVLRAWNSAGVAVPAVTVVDLVEARARLRPDAPAVRSGTTTVGFAELLARAAQVARGLIVAGAGPETLVAVAVPRTEELPIALFAVLLSGAGYLPLDITRPPQRLRSVLSDARPVAVLTTAVQRACVPSGDLPIVLMADNGHYSTAPITDGERNAPLRPDSLAYVRYPGAPGPGVGVTHRNVVELFANTVALFEFDDADVWTLAHSVDSDCAVWELWCALAGGGSVVVVDDRTAASPEEFRALLVREQVTVLNQTPAAFYRLTETDPVADTGTGALVLRYVLVGARTLDLHRVRRWFDRFGGTDTEQAAPWPVSLSGSTETTGHFAFLTIDEQMVDTSAAVIGRALPGLDAFVLDDRLHPAPVGARGEIYVAGAQLARGYLGDPGRTAAHFVADPFGAPGSRMYRGGDIGRWVGLGGRANLEYAGHADTWRVPAEALDRPEPESDGTAPHIAPSGRVQTALAEVFTEVLGVERIGVDDDFFALGGHSPLAARAVLRINDTLQADIDLRTLYEAPTVAALSADLKPGAGAPPPRPTLERGERPERIPLSPAQHQIWLLDRFDPGPGVRPLALAIRLAGALDVSALRHAISDVLERHEILRTRYPADADGMPYQEILPVTAMLRGGLDTATTDDIAGRIDDMRRPGFDVTEHPPVRSLLLDVENGAEDDHVLALVVHPLVADQRSLAALARDLMSAYRARIGGESPRWSPLPVQYADYAIWQRAVVGVDTEEGATAGQQLDYWRHQLRGLVASPELPLDRRRPQGPPGPAGPAATIGFALDAEAHRSLDTLARDRGATLFMVLHAAVGALLHRMAGTDDLTVGALADGRGEPGLDSLVGRFENLLVLRTRVAPGSTFVELLARIRRTDLAAFANADIPFERVVEIAPAPARERLFGVVLAVRRDEEVLVESPGLVARGLGRDLPGAEFDLRIELDPGRAGAPGELRAALTYATDLFDPETVRTFGGGLRRILTAVAANPLVRVADIDLRDESGWSRASRPAADPATSAAGTAFIQTLGAWAENDPDGPAVVRGAETVTYRELDARSSRLARTLIARGCGPGTAVVSSMPRGVDSVVATWAILKAGAALVAVEAVEPAVAAGLVVETGLAMDPAPELPGVKWLLLGDPGAEAEIAAASPRPVTYAHRSRPLRAGDLVVVEKSGRRVAYDQLSAGVVRIPAATELTCDSRTFRHGRGDTAAAVSEIVAAGVAGASVVLSAPDAPETTPVGEWITHLWSDTAGLTRLDPATLTDLTALILDEDVAPGPAWSAEVTVLALPALSL